MSEIAKIKGYDIRDKKLADGTQQTTMANTGTVQGWDANGNAIFIPRDSVVQILSDVINSNLQSSVTSLFGMGTNSTPAAINMSNLASVLGVWKPLSIASKSVLANSTVQFFNNGEKKMYGLVYFIDWSTEHSKSYIICGETLGEQGSTYSTSTDIKIVTSNYGHIVSIQNNTNTARTVTLYLQGGID